MLYDRLADLDLQVDSYDIELRERPTTSGFTRTTTVLSLHGCGHTGHGEDVTYDSEPHHTLVRGPAFPLTGSYTFGTFADYLDGVELFPGDRPNQSVFRRYRR